MMKRYSLSGFDIREYDELDSTNTLAEHMPLSDLVDRMVILTWRQSKGRGQATNKWESEPDRNISMTVAFRPRGLEASRQFAVSMVIALGCRDFLARYVDAVSVKWPNDIYVGDRKISGILIDHRISGSEVELSLCGVGININQEEFRSDAPNPVSLCQLLHRQLPLQKMLGELLECIGRRYEDVLDYKGLERDFLASLYRREGMFDWEDGKGMFRASVVGVDPYGQLVLKDAEGKERVYGFKEVKYRSAHIRFAGDWQP